MGVGPAGEGGAQRWVPETIANSTPVVEAHRQNPDSTKYPDDRPLREAEVQDLRHRKLGIMAVGYISRCSSVRGGAAAMPKAHSSETGAD